MLGRHRGDEQLGSSLNTCREIQRIVNVLAADEEHPRPRLLTFRLGSSALLKNILKSPPEVVPAVVGPMGGVNVHAARALPDCAHQRDHNRLGREGNTRTVADFAVEDVVADELAAGPKSREDLSVGRRLARRIGAPMSLASSLKAIGWRSPAAADGSSDRMIRET
jgi:hypothetical protein